MLKDKLTKIITSKPDVIQFAKDRKYEEAWIVPLSKGKPTDEEINKYLSKEKFEVIIVEYIWNSTDDNNRFVLTLFLDKKCTLQDPKKFIDICLSLFYDYSNFNYLVETIDSQIIGKSYLLTNEIDSVNLSVFNYWLSVGPVELWKQGDTFNLTLITQKIKKRPEIEITKLNYQGLLFRFNVSGNDDGPYYGIKTPCCDKQNDSWVVNHKKIDYWMKIMLKV